jgi:hypothetical protein
MARTSLLRFRVGLVLVLLGFVVAASPSTALPHAVVASPAPMGATVASLETGTTGTHTSTTSPAKTRVCVARAYDASRDASRSRTPARGPRLAAKEVPKFMQSTAASTFRHGPFAGRSIGEVAEGLRSGAISPRDLSVEVIRRRLWEARVQNRCGNYLDRFGDAGSPQTTHGIHLMPR